MNPDTPNRKPFVRLKGEVKTPPFSEEGRRKAGWLIGRLQDGEAFGMPHLRPMPTIAAGVSELRINDGGHNWRVVVFVDDSAVVLLEVFAKKTRKTPAPAIEACRERLRKYLEVRG